MKMLQLPPLEVINDLLEYEPGTGLLRWKKWRGNTAAPGSIAGTSSSSSGYLLVAVAGVRVPAHRIIYKMVHGVDPDGLIDHIDGDKFNNRADNLRLCTPMQNQGNSVKPRHNKSGRKGVSWHTREQRWVAQIKQGKKKVWLGSFSDKEEAARAYERAAKAYFGEFANTGEGL